MNQSGPLEDRRPTGRGTRRMRVVALLLSLLLSAALAEVGARIFWTVRYGVPFGRPDRILYAFYPGLQRIDHDAPRQTDQFYDILLLGGSVLNRNYGAVEQDLLEELAFKGRRNVRIFNLALAAQTSRDSRLKYAALGDARFELVVFYHGINDVRANNAPPEIFQQDYSHYSWYEIINSLAPSHGRASLALPYTLRYMAIKMRQAMNPDRYVPTNQPREEWVRHGQTPKSAVPFEDNLGAILDLAALRHEQALIMTFAMYVPNDYSIEAFREKRLDYGQHRSPIEIWGAREHVVNAVAAHNAVIRKAAAGRPDVLFVDQAQLMAGTPRWFNDPCHFTILGSSKFVEHMLGVLLK